MTSKPTIAIDGPAGAGKSSVAKLLAARLALTVLDTGAMYRCVALLATEAGIQDDALMCSQVAAETKIEFDGLAVFANGRDVSDEIRQTVISQWASKLSTIPELRKALVVQQKKLVEVGGFVLEGRDTTTVVAPGADLKVFLTASIEERARRRWLELRQKEPACRLQDVVQEVVERDHRDYTRQESPLTLGEDVHIVESFGKSVDEVVEAIVGLLPSHLRQ